MAPEINLQTPYNKVADFYSFGALIYEMICELPPRFDNCGKSEEVHYPDYLLEDEETLLKGLLENEP